MGKAESGAFKGSYFILLELEDKKHWRIDTIFLNDVPSR